MYTYVVDRRREALKSLSGSWHISIAILCMMDQFTDREILKTVHTSLQHLSCKIKLLTQEWFCPRFQRSMFK